MARSRAPLRLDRVAATLGATCCLVLAPAQAPAQQPDASPSSKAAPEPAAKPAKASQVRRTPRKAPAKPEPGASERSADPSRTKPAAKPASVAQLCAGKGYWAREWCETKACFRSENQSDAVCRSRNEQRPVVNQP